MISMLIFIILTSVFAADGCPEISPGAQGRVAEHIEDSREIVVRAMAKDDPCRFTNIQKNFDHGPYDGGGRVGQIVGRDNQPIPGGSFVMTNAVKFYGLEGSDNLVVDIKDEAGVRTQKFSLDRSSIYDARGAFVITECLPPSCQSYTFYGPGTEGNRLLTITTTESGEVVTRLIINAGEESHISHVPLAENQEQRRRMYEARGDLAVFAALGDGSDRNLRRCYEPFED